MTTTNLISNNGSLLCRSFSKTTFIIGCLLCLVWSASAQSPAYDTKLKTDSLLSTGLETGNFNHARKLEDAFKILARWSSRMLALPDTNVIHEDLARLDSQSQRLMRNLSDARYLKNLRYLKANLILTNNALARLNKHQQSLSAATSSLQQFDKDLKTKELKSTLAIETDTSATGKNLASQQKAVLETWMYLRKISNESLKELSDLQLRISKVYIREEFERMVTEEALKDFNRKLYTKPVPLMGTPKSHPTYLDVREEGSISFDLVKTMIYNFIINHKAQILTNLILFILILLIIFNNHRILAIQLQDKQSREVAPMITSKPLATAFTIGFFFSPLLYRNMPAVISEILIIGLLASITALLWKRVSKQIFWRWVALCLLFIRFGFMNLLVGTSLEARWGLVLLNAGSIYIILSSYRIFKKERRQNITLLTIVIAITSLQQLAAIVLNIAGYYNAALLHSVNSIFNLTTAVSITLSIQIIIEFLSTVDLRLQKHKLVSADEAGLLPSKVKPYLATLGIVLWLLMLLDTLNYDRILFSEISAFLDKKQQIGSSTFTYGNIIIFCLIFVVSVLLSKVSAFIIDLYATRSLSHSGRSQLKNGKLFLRLIILIGGLVLALIASGIPTERLTIILGALSVGIGLGLQHLVNNLVSGIIMAIEQPMKVGDVITMDGVTGKVTDIGLRSTIVEAKNGVNVYIPNGEFLSGTLVNMSAAKNRMPVSINFLVGEDTNLVALKALVNDVIGETKAIMQSAGSKVVIQNSTDKGIVTEVNFWIPRNASESAVRDMFMEKLIPALQKAGIEFGSKSRNYSDDADN